MPPIRTVEVGHGPEDVLVGPGGVVFTGLADGRILRLCPERLCPDAAPPDENGPDKGVSGGSGPEEVVTVEGRPLGLEFLPDGRLLVCAAGHGLQAVDLDTGAVEVLADTAAGEPLLVCNNAAVAADGTVYFSDSSRRFALEHWKADLLEHSGTGRLLRCLPDGRVQVLLTGLQFANGVVLDPGEEFVLVAETGAYQVTRLWLTGERAGRSEVFAGGLPGSPDNLSLGSDGLVWVALASPRDPLVDALFRFPKWVRQAAWRLPESWQPGPRGTVWVQAYDLGGRLVHDLQAPATELGGVAGDGAAGARGTGDRSVFHTVTGVRERDGKVYLGSLEADRIAVFDLGEHAEP